MSSRFFARFTGATVAVLLGTTALASAQVAPKAPAKPDTPAIQQHVDMAKALARDEFAFFHNRYCNPGDTAGQEAGAKERAAMVMPPTKVFDNLYYVGLASVGSWALKTSAGIILFDALNTPEEAQQFIVGGLAKLGMDAKDIKYIVVMHGHGDHFGGAQYLKDKYGPHILMSAIDWDYMNARKNAGGGNPRWKDLIPKHDTDVTDGQKLTLGDTTVTLFITPGHTPGTLSAMLDVYDNGQKHTAAFWGGTGLPGTKDSLTQYESSVRKFWLTASAAGAT